MGKLEDAREQINIIDKEMATLFSKRMEAVKAVAESKQEMGLPVFNPGREQEVIKRGVKNLNNPDIESYYINYLKYVMQLSKSYQHRLLKGLRVAYSGVPGAFANIAAKRIFADGIDIPYPDFAAAYAAVVNGECDCAVLPIENSFAGDVSQVMDLAFSGDLFINGVYDLEITQNLLGVKGASLRDVREVISHRQALDQCAVFIKEHSLVESEASNTAAAAQAVAERADKSVAAIASEETAGLYGLQVIEKAINQSHSNTTRFAVFSRTQSAGKDGKFIMFFTVGNTPGALSRAISVIGENGFNMRALKSRPTKEQNFEYYFYVECDGGIRSDSGKKMLRSLKEACSSLRIVGIYENEIAI